MIPTVLIIAYKTDDPTPAERRILAEAASFARDRSLAPPGNLILKTGRGKPYINDGGVHFSLSHSRDYWLCALAPTPVGLDLQEKRPCPYEELANRFFHPQESKYVLRHGKEGFYQVWTAKESYVKYLGTGIDGSFAKFSTAPQKGKVFGPCQGGFLHHISFEKGYSLCLCTPKPMDYALVKKYNQ